MIVTIAMGLAGIIWYLLETSFSHLTDVRTRSY